jgi:hypothetical protein
VRRHLCAVDEGEAGVGREGVEHPLDRAAAERGLDLLHLRHLFGEVHVDRTLRRESGEAGEVLRRDGAEAVRREAEHRIGRQRPDRFGGSDVETGEGVRIGAEAHLSGAERPPVAAAEAIVDGQEREADAGRGRGGGNAGGHLG